MLLSLTIVLILTVVVLFILDSNKDPINTSQMGTYFSPFYSETVVKQDYSVQSDTIWKTLTDFGRYNAWFPGIQRFTPVVNSGRYAHRFSFDQFTLEPGASVCLRPFSLSPSFRGQILAVEKNAQLSFELKFNPLYKELVSFDLKPAGDGTSVTCRRSSRGPFSFMALLGFSSKKSYILNNLGYFIPPEKVKTKTDDTDESTTPSLSRNAIIAQAVQAALGGNLDLINAIPDKPTRGLAKAVHIRAQRKEGNLPPQYQKALTEKPPEASTAKSPQNTGEGRGFNTEDLIAYVVNKALDGDDEPLNAIEDRVARGKAKAMMVKIKRGSLERPPMPKAFNAPSNSIDTHQESPQEESTKSKETDEVMFERLVKAGVAGNMDEINAIDNRVLRGKIKAAIVKEKRTNTS